MHNKNEVIGKYRWNICGLLFFATTVNYLDRQVLSLLAPALSEDMFPKEIIGSIIGIGGMAGGIGGVFVSKLGGALFDYYEALGHVQTGYTIMFVICAVAYLVAWTIMKAFVPKYTEIMDL